MSLWDHDRCQKCGTILPAQTTRGRRAKNCGTCRKDQQELYREKNKDKKIVKEKHSD